MAMAWSIVAIPVNPLGGERDMQCNGTTDFHAITDGKVATGRSRSVLLRQLSENAT